jgi:hypothetical protein
MKRRIGLSLVAATLCGLLHPSYSQAETICLKLLYVNALDQPTSHGVPNAIVTLVDKNNRLISGPQLTDQHGYAFLRLKLPKDSGLEVKAKIAVPSRPDAMWNAVLNIFTDQQVFVHTLNELIDPNVGVSYPSNL